MLALTLTHITFRVNSKDYPSPVKMTNQDKFILPVQINAKVHNFSPPSFLKLSLWTGGRGKLRCLYRPSSEFYFVGEAYRPNYL